MDAQQGSMVSSLVMLALMFGIFYLRKGNTVITIGGIYGQIVDVKDDNLVLQIADNVRIRTVRGAVSSVLGKGEAAKDKDPGLAE